MKKVMLQVVLAVLGFLGFELCHECGQLIWKHESLCDACWNDVSAFSDADFEDFLGEDDDSDPETALEGILEMNAQAEACVSELETEYEQSLADFLRYETLVSDEPAKLDFVEVNALEGDTVIDTYSFTTRSASYIEKRVAEMRAKHPNSKVTFEVEKEAA